MTKQPPLFETRTNGAGREQYIAPAQHNNEPGREAARMVEQRGQVGRECRVILDYLKQAESPQLREIICMRTGISNQAACGRLNELVKRGLVIEAEKREARSGVMCKTYTTSEKGRAT